MRGLRQPWPHSVLPNWPVCAISWAARSSASSYREYHPVRARRPGSVQSRPVGRHHGSRPCGACSVRCADAGADQPACPAQSMTANEYMWRDPIPPLCPRRANRGPWTSDEGWLINPVLPSVQCTMIRPAWWPYADIFCLKACEIPNWVQLQEPAEPVAHLPLRGYCSPTCYGLCLRPVMVGERDGRQGHKCFECLKAHCD